MTTELTWKFNGTAIAGTSALGAAWTVDVPKGGVLRPPSIQTKHHYNAVTDAMVQTSPLRIRPEREWGLVVHADVSGLSGSNVERKLVAGWEELANTFRPTLGAVEVECTRKDLAGNNVVRYILAEQHHAPSYTPRTGDAAGNDQAGAYAGNGGYIIYPIGGVALFPYWIGATLLDQTTAPAAAEIEVETNPHNITINNPGDRWCGLRIVVKAGSVSGTVSGFSVTNGANGDAVILADAGFTAGDALDWYATDPTAISITGSPTFSGVAGGRIRIEPGNNVITAARTGGTGSLFIELSWPDLRLSL